MVSLNAKSFGLQQKIQAVAKNSLLTSYLHCTPPFHHLAPPGTYQPDTTIPSQIVPMQDRRNRVHNLKFQALMPGPHTFLSRQKPEHKWEVKLADELEQH
jgi:hypothetical protein